MDTLPVFPVLMVAFIWRSGKVMWRAAFRGHFPPLLPLHSRPYEDEKEQKICPPALDGYHHATLGKVFWRNGKVMRRSTASPRAATACRSLARAVSAPAVGKRAALSQATRAIPCTPWPSQTMTNCTLSSVVGPVGPRCRRCPPVPTSDDRCLSCRRYGWRSRSIGLRSSSVHAVGRPRRAPSPPR